MSEETPLRPLSLEAEAGSETEITSEAVVTATEPWEEDAPEVDLDRLSYRQLVWRRFKKSKLALVGSVILAVFYTAALLAEFFAPYDYRHDNIRLRYVPPQRVRFF